MAILLAAVLTAAQPPHCPELACAEQMRNWRAAALHARVFGTDTPPMPPCARTAS